MGFVARAAAIVGAATLASIVSATLPTHAHAEKKKLHKIGVDPRQSGLDAAFVDEEPRSDLDRFRAHFGLDLVGWVRQTPWPRFVEGAPGPRDDAAALGYRRFGLGFGLGHGFADAVVVGVRFEYELTRNLQRTPGEAERAPKALGFSAMPYLEIMLARREAFVRPYFMVRGGVGGSIVTTDGSSPLENQLGSTFSLLHPSLGAGLGAHAFITPEVSLDGAFTVDHRWEYARGPGALPNPEAVAMGIEPVQRRGRHDAFGRRFSSALVLSISRWF